jgi:hypothetical protein
MRQLVAALFGGAPTNSGLELQRGEREATQAEQSAATESATVVRQNKVTGAEAGQPLATMDSEHASAYIPLARQLQPDNFNSGEALARLCEAAVAAKRQILAGDKRGAVETLKAIADACLINVSLHDFSRDMDHVHEKLDRHLEALWAEVINDPAESDPPEIEYWEGDAEEQLGQEEARKLANQMDLPEWPLPTLSRTPGSQVRAFAKAEQLFFAQRLALGMGMHSRLGESSLIRKLPCHIIEHISDFLRPPASVQLLSRADIDMIASWVHGWMHNQDTVFDFSASRAGEPKAFYELSRVQNYGLLRECEMRKDMCFGPPLTEEGLRRVARSRPTPSARSANVNQRPELLAAVGAALRKCSDELHARALAYFELRVTLPIPLTQVEFEATLRICDGATPCSLPPGVQRFRFHTLAAMRAAFGEGAHPTIFRKESKPLDSAHAAVAGVKGPCRYWIEELELVWLGTKELHVIMWPRFAWRDRQLPGSVRWVSRITTVARRLHQHDCELPELTPANETRADASTSPSDSARAAERANRRIDERAGFAPHEEVTVQLLQARPELNGQRATVLGWDEASKRYMVKLAMGGTPIKLKPECLLLHTQRVE